jgi:cytochrome c553
MRRRAAFAIVLALSAAGSRAEDASSLAAAYGRHLASECTSCHRSDAGAGAIPSLAGRKEAEIIALLQDFRYGRKTNPVMVSVANSLDEKETEALAAYFASLPASASAPTPPQ